MRSVTVILTMSLFMFSSTSNAQKSKDKDKGVIRASSVEGSSSYTTGLGIRLGYESGITFKHFFKPNNAFEGILSSGWGYGGSRLTFLYEYQKAFPDIQGFNWFVGGGFHIGSYTGRYYKYYNYHGYGYGYYDKHGKWHSTAYQDRYVSIGIDLILGLEYQFADAPFTIGIDIKPYFDFYGPSEHFADGAITLRYILK
jgi:hypothetical protein